MIRILLYGDVDLNLIDGSAIWLASLAEVLGGISDVAVTVLQKTPLSRELVVEGLSDLPRVRLVDPWDCAAGAAGLATRLPQRGPRRLEPTSAAYFIEELDRREPFDVIWVRGLLTAATLVRRPGVGERLWTYITNPAAYQTTAEQQLLQEVTWGSHRLVCQTDAAKSALLQSCPGCDHGRVLLLPPMIPALGDCRTEHRSVPHSPKLGYSGKFSPTYLTLETLGAFERIRRRIPGAEFHLAGDKIHQNAAVPGFAEEVTRRLKGTAGVCWHGGLSRREANALLNRVDVAASWRSTEFDESVELSTKVLEYSALGIPVLLNPSRVQRTTFGADYPGYVSSEDEFVERFLALVQSPTQYRAASEHVRRIAEEFTYERHRERLRPLLPNHGNPPPQRHSPAKLVVMWSGHDFKFLSAIQRSIKSTDRYRFLQEEHAGHVVDQPDVCRKMLTGVDVIFCEWCLGNAEWYSRNKRPGQRLIVRLHHQELQLPYLDRIEWDNVDHLIFICPNNRDLFLERFPSLAPKTSLIYNSVDCDLLNQPKLEGAEFNLGLLGTAPRRKAPHLAFELFRKLKARDSRFTLCIKGSHPSKYPWLWRQASEREYYQAFDRTIHESPHVNSVVFDPQGNDVADWFTKIGFILSVSEHEGSHQAVAEGMASGAIPIIRNWAGADRMYPPNQVFGDLDSAVDLVVDSLRDPNYQQRCESARKFAREHFDLPRVVEQFVAILDGTIPGSAGRIRRREAGSL